MQLHLFAFWFVNYNLVKYKIMIIILKIMLSINQLISIQCLRKTRGNNSIFLPLLLNFDKL